jgi:hypothetical protein
MSAELRVILLLVISLTHAGWTLDIELDLAVAPARVAKKTGGMGAGAALAPCSPMEVSLSKGVSP